MFTKLVGVHSLWYNDGIVFGVSMAGMQPGHHHLICCLFVSGMFTIDWTKPENSGFATHSCILGSSSRKCVSLTLLPGDAETHVVTVWRSKGKREIFVSGVVRSSDGSISLPSLGVFAGDCHHCTLSRACVWRDESSPATRIWICVANESVGAVEVLECNTLPRGNWSVRACPTGMKVDLLPQECIHDIRKGANGLVTTTSSGKLILFGMNN